MNQFRLVQAIDGLGQRVVVAVAATANRRLDARFGQSFGRANDAYWADSTGRLCSELR